MPESSLLITVYDILIVCMYTITLNSLSSDPQLILIMLASTIVSVAACETINKVMSKTFDKLVLNSAEIPKQSLLKNKKKFQDMFYILTECILSVAIELHIFQNHNWWSDTSAIWTDKSTRNITLFYTITLGLWIKNAFYTRFLETRDKDFTMMYTHHLITIFLITGSYLSNNMNIGICVMYLHQTSDIVIALCKATHYLSWDYQHTQIPVAEGIFVINLFTWFYTRLYTYPLVLINSIVNERHLSATCATTYTAQCSGMLGLAVVLQVMHVVWFYEMIKVVGKLIQGESAGQAGGSYLDEQAIKGSGKND